MRPSSSAIRRRLKIPVESSSYLSLASCPKYIELCPCFIQNDMGVLRVSALKSSLQREMLRILWSILVSIMTPAVWVLLRRRWGSGIT